MSDTEQKFKIIDSERILLYSTFKDTYGKRIFSITKNMIVFENVLLKCIEVWNISMNKRKFAQLDIFKLIGVLNERDICYLTLKKENNNQDDVLMFIILNSENLEVKEYKLNSTTVYPEFVYQINKDILLFGNQDKMYSFDLRNGKESTLFEYTIYKRIGRINKHYGNIENEKMLGKFYKVEKLNEQLLLISNYVPMIFNIKTMQIQSYIEPIKVIDFTKGTIYRPNFYFINMEEGRIFPKLTKNIDRKKIKILWIGFFDSDYFFELFNYKLIKTLNKSEDMLYNIIKYNNGEFIIRSYKGHLFIYNGRTGDILQTIKFYRIFEHYIFDNYLILRDSEGVSKSELHFENYDNIDKKSKKKLKLK